MRVRFSALLLWSVSAVATEQTSPEQVTTRQISTYQSEIEQGCKRRGRERGDPADRVDASCACIMEKLRGSLSIGEWQKAYYHAVKEQHEQEWQIVLPHLSKANSCKK